MSNDVSMISVYVAVIKFKGNVLTPTNIKTM